MEQQKLKAVHVKDYMWGLRGWDITDTVFVFADHDIRLSCCCEQR